MDVQFKKFDYIDDIQDVVGWHKDHAAINFPDSKYKPELFRESVRESCAKDFNVMWTAWVKDEKLGWLWVAKNYDVYKEIDYCDLRYIHLTEKHRGQGFGSQLLAQAEKQAKEWGCKEIRLGTSFDNTKALLFYLNHGYFVKRQLFEKKLC